MSDSLPTQPRWHQSLIARIIVLCVVLLLCLLASVYFFTTQYYGHIVTHMEDRANNAAEQVRSQLDRILVMNPDMEIEDVIDSLTDEFTTDVKVDPGDSGPVQPLVQPGKGGFYFEARQVVELSDGTSILVMMELDFNPQTEVIRAFQNEYLSTITIIFVLTLCLMIYLIAKALRPIRELSESCAEIAEGNLQYVKAEGNTAEIVALEKTFNAMVDSLKEKEIVEGNLRQAQRLSAIGNLAAGVAHDVRNPLNAIKLLSSHALDSLNAPENDHTAKQIRTIRTEADRLEDIVSGFLSLAKEEELNFEETSIDTILAECLRLMKKDAEMRGVNLTAELRAGDMPLMLDTAKMSRAILNVLINALEACPEDGRVRLFSRTSGDTCEVEIRDDGPGMDDETLERIFDAYFTTKAMGTGLGLSITRGIIEEHQGSVTISSSPGAGSQALITLPTSPPTS
ncbi:MAG: ATP-binding protein [Candidatus Hydrogenedentota bacterium]